MPEAGGAARSGAADEPVGSLAIVLHSHMPYVEGYGTYPFGEEWLFDAFLRSYAPVLDVARSLTMSVTPVLADQLEDEGVGARLAEFAERFRIGSALLDDDDMGEEFAAALADERARHERSLAALEAAGGDPLAAFQRAEEEGRVELITSCATHAVLPLVATRQGRLMQLETALASHRRRFGSEQPGLWLPECAYEPGLERLVGELGLPFFCVDQSAFEEPLDALSPVSTGAGPVAFTIDWEAIQWLWSLDGYPSHVGHRDFHRESLRGMRAWTIDGRPYDPDAAQEVALGQARELLDAVAGRLERFRAERGRPGLVVFAIDTELIGHWWWEGPTWLEAVIEGAGGRGVELVTLEQAARAHPPEPRELRRSSWGEGKGLRTWDSPAVADIAWAARRLELRLIRALRARRLPRAAARRAARELMAAQSSDWAFLDGRGQAGDYAFRRASEHGEAMLHAIDSGAFEPSERVRSLVPDLELEPLLAP